MVNFEKRNHPITLKLTKEELSLFEDTIKELNKKSRFKISKTSLMRVLLLKGCQELKCGELSSIELLFNNP